MATDCKSGLIRVTTHRIIYSGEKTIHLSHEQVKSLEKEATSFFHTHKNISITLKKSVVLLKIQFKKEGRDNFFEMYSQALNKKVWEIQKQKEAEKEAASKPPPKKDVSQVLGGKQKQDENFSTKSAGITGIIRTTKTKAEQEKQNLTQAFSDLDALMENAEKMVKLAKKFQEEQKKKKEQSGEKGEDSEAEELFLQMGVVSSITK